MFLQEHICFGDGGVAVDTDDILLHPDFNKHTVS
jgi:hypothetical protein